MFAIIECDSALNLKRQQRNWHSFASIMWLKCCTRITTKWLLVGWLGGCLPPSTSDNKYQFALMGATQFVCSNHLHSSKFIPSADRTSVRARAHLCTHLATLIETDSLCVDSPNAHIRFINPIEYSMANTNYLRRAHACSRARTDRCFVCH